MNDQTNSKSMPLACTTMSQYKVQPVRWIASGYLPRGKVMIVAGDGGTGKSSISLDVAACLTTGRVPFGLKEEPNLPPSDVLIYAREDDPADTLSPRLRAAGADLGRVHLIHGIEQANGHYGPFSLRDVDSLRETLRQKPDVRLLIIDPISGAVAAAGADTHKDGEVRAVLEPLSELAAEFDLLILCVAHTGKGTDRKAAHKILGSVAFVNVSRLAFTVDLADDDPDIGYLCPVKCNLGKWPSSLKFRRRPLTLAEQDAALRDYADHLDKDDRQELARALFRLEWLGQCDMDADTATQQHRKPEASNDVGKAAEWLKAFLASGPKPSSVCVDHGNAALKMRHSLNWWRDNVYKLSLCGKPRKVGFGKSQYWVWELSQTQQPQQPHDSQCPQHSYEAAEDTEDTEDTEDKNTLSPQEYEALEPSEDELALGDAWEPPASELPPDALEFNFEVL